MVDRMNIDILKNLKYTIDDLEIDYRNEIKDSLSVLHFLLTST